MPRVSVVIPAYNSERYIGESVQSVLDQTYGDLEVIVVDDGSTDRTSEVVRQMSDPRIRLVAKPNGGQASARNFGLKLVTGDLVAFNDADDRWTPRKLEWQIALLDAHPELGCVYGLITNFDDEGRVGKSGFERRIRGWAFSEMLEDPFICSQQALIPRSVVEQCGPFDEGFRVAGQSLLFLRLAMRYPIDYVDEVVVWRRHHAQNISKTGGVRAQVIRAQTRCRILETIYYEQGGRDHIKPDVARRIFADAYCALGKKHRYAGELDQSWKNLQRALEYCPLHWRARYERFLTRMARLRAPTASPQCSEAVHGRS